MVYKVSNMHCQHCVMHIEKALKDADVKGVVDLKSKTVTSDSENVVAILDKIGYKATK